MAGREKRAGSCLCGKITIEVSGPMREVVACHCGQCRKQTGSFYMATNAPDEALSITGGEYLKWYQSSENAKRGFCSNCGSALFWKHKDDPFTSIMAGCFEPPTGLKLSRHIFVSDKGDYYDIDDGLPQSG